MESQIVLPGSATLRLDWKLAVICCCSPHLGACEDRCPARKKHLRNKNTHDRHKVWYSGLPLGFRPRAPNDVMQLQTSLSQALCFRLGKHRTHKKEQNSSLTLSFVSKGHHTPMHDCLPPILRREDHRMQRTQNSHCRPPHLQVMFLSVIRHTLVSPIKHQGRRDRASATAGKRLLQISKKGMQITKPVRSAYFLLKSVPSCTDKMFRYCPLDFKPKAQRRQQIALKRDPINLRLSDIVHAQCTLRVIPWIRW